MESFFYDGILYLPVPIDVNLIAFTDDIAIVVTAHNADQLEQLINPVLIDIEKWMAENGLSLALTKSECIILTKKHVYRNPTITFSGCQIPVKRVIC